MAPLARHCVAGSLGEAGLDLAMEADWKLSHIQALCFGMGTPAYSYNYWPEQDEWQEGAVRIYRKAVQKANSTKGIGPMYVCTWLALRAGNRGWDKLFNVWADRAHSSGKMDRDSVETELFKELSHSLALEERIEVSWNRFSNGYEASFGYPIESSPLSNEIREEKE